MNNINKNSYYALKLDHNSYAAIESFSDFSLCGGNPFTLVLLFYPLDNDGNFCLMKQEGAFEVGYRDGQFYYSAEGMEDIVAQGIPPVLNRWNSIAITYDGATRAVYYEGLDFFREERVTEFCTNGNKLVIGDGFDGYIRKACCFSGAMEWNELSNVLYGMDKEEDRKQAVFYLDFTGQTPEDYGKNNVEIQLSGRAREVNVVKTLQFENNGYLQSIEPENGAYGKIFGSEYTIWTKIYANLSGKSESVLFNNGGYGNQNGITLGLANTTTGARPFFDCQGTRITADQDIPYDQWTDVAAVINGTEVSLYADGTKIGTGGISALPEYTPYVLLTLGNALQNGRPCSNTYFDGYMDSFAVFHYALSAEKLTSFVETPPFIFNDGIEMMYTFYNGSSLENVSSATYTLSNASIAMQEGTESAVGFDIPAYVDETENIVWEEFDLWETNFIGKLITGYVEAQTGLKPTSGFTEAGDLAPGAAKWVKSKIVKLPSAQNCVVRYRNTTPEDMAEIAEDIVLDSESTEEFVEVFYSASEAAGGAGGAAGGTVGATTAITTAGTSAGGILPPVLGSGIALAGIAAFMRVIIENLTKEDPPEKKPTGECEIVVTKIRFHYPDDSGKYDYSQKGIPVAVGDAGAEGGKKEIITDPEWISSDLRVEKKPFCYIQKKLAKPKIKVSFLYATKDPDKCPVYADYISADISVSAKGTNKRTALGDVPKQWVTLNPGEEKEYEYELTGSKIPEEAVGAVHFTWMWKDSFQVIGSSSHDAYIICDEPKAPWDYASDDANTVLSEEFLNLWKDVAKDAEPMKAVTVQTFSEMAVPGFYNCGHFKYEEVGEDDKIGNYATINIDLNTPLLYKSIFEAEYLSEVINGTGILNVKSLDISAIMELIYRLNGLETYACMICSAIPPVDLLYVDDFENATNSVGIVNIKTVSVVPVGEKGEKEIETIVHFVLTDKGIKIENSDGEYEIVSNTTRVIDFTFKIHETGKFLSYKQFADDEGDIVYKMESENDNYRDTIFSKYIYCELSCVYSAIEFTNEQKQKFVADYISKKRSVQIGYIKSMGRFVHNGRPPFPKTLTQTAMVIPKGSSQSLARCHQLSYKTIINVVKSIWNIYFKISTTKPDEGNLDVKAVEKIKDLFNIVEYDYKNKYMDLSRNSAIPTQQKIAVDALHNAAGIEIVKIETQIGITETFKQTMTKMCELVFSLNCLYFNLRVANANWNSSIQEFYDPLDWAIYGKISRQLLLRKDGFVKKIMQEEFIYVISEDGDDCQKLLLLNELRNSLNKAMSDEGNRALKGFGFSLNDASWGTGTYRIIASSDNNAGYKMQIPRQEYVDYKQIQKCDSSGNVSVIFKDF